MPEDTDKYQRQQVQRSMFRTVAGNLIRQLQESGCTRDELIGFANEILQTIIDKGFDAGAQDGRARHGNGLISRVEGLPPLSARGATPLAEGVSMSPMDESDEPVLRSWLDDPVIAESLAEYTLPEIIGASRRSPAPPDVAAFVLHAEPGNRPIGLVGLIHIDANARQGELVKMIGDPEQRGKRLAKTATQMLVDFAFDELKLNRVYLRTLGGHMQNIRLNESLGFRFEGVLRQGAYVAGRLNDIVIMSMVAADRADTALRGGPGVPG
jgi:diamine N-acetyltransferase